MTVPKKMRKVWLVAAGSAAVLCAAVVAARKVVGSGKNDAVFYTVRTESYENVIEIAGTVSAAKSQSLKSLNDGTVVGVFKSEISIHGLCVNLDTRLYTVLQTSKNEIYL